MEDTNIHGYKLLAPFHTKNAGFCRWTFATRNGQVYFLKEFNDPVYPDSDTLSETLRQNRIRECIEFEDTKVQLYHKINQVSDGNLVRIVELFRWDSHYYLVTRKMGDQQISLADVAQLPLEDRLMLCRTAIHGLMQLHSAGIIHADIKQHNVILSRTVTGKVTAKLIDFDAGFFEATPPDPEDLHFDHVYLAPEGFLYMSYEPVELTCKMDVFSMGLLMHEYLTGQLPGYDSQFDAAHEAVLNGHPLRLDPTLPPKVRKILEGMLQCDPDCRSTSEEVYQALGMFFGGVSEDPKPPVDPAPPAGSSKGSMAAFFYDAGDL